VCQTAECLHVIAVCVSVAAVYLLHSFADGIVADDVCNVNAMMQYCSRSNAVGAPRQDGALKGHVVRCTYCTDLLPGLIKQCRSICTRSATGVTTALQQPHSRSVGSILTIVSTPILPDRSLSSLAITLVIAWFACAQSVLANGETKA